MYIILYRPNLILAVRKQKGLALGLKFTGSFKITNLVSSSSNQKHVILTKMILKKDKRRKNLQTEIQTATTDISNCCYKIRHFTHSCIVCELQMGALGDVHFYL